VVISVLEEYVVFSFRIKFQRTTCFVNTPVNFFAQMYIPNYDFKTMMIMMTKEMKIIRNTIVEILALMLSVLKIPALILGP
jgi:hypothetical protein